MNHPRAFVLTIKRLSDRLKRTQEHFQQVGVTAEPFYGFDYQVSGLFTDHKYEVDHPGSGYIMGKKQVNLGLSHYMLWQVLAYQPEDSFWILEDDAKFDENWKQQFEDAQSSLPPDWDFVYLGSCCAYDKPQYKVGTKNLHVVNFPMCTHAYQVRKKALPILIENCQKVWAPIDISLCFDVLPKLKHFTIVPRMVAQFDTMLPP